MGISPNIEQFLDSDDKDDEGDLDEWEDTTPNSDDKDNEEGDLNEQEEPDKVKLEDEVVDERMSFEGKIKDVGKPEELQANNNSSIPTKDNNNLTNLLEGGASHRMATTSETLQPAMAVEADGGWGNHTSKDEDVIITMPYGMQMAVEKAEEDLEMVECAREKEEDQAMALWLSDSEDNSDEQILFSSNKIALEDLLEVDKELWNEMSRREEPRKEYYSFQSLTGEKPDFASTNDQMHNTSSLKPEEKSLDWWDEPVEGEREEMGN